MEKILLGVSFHYSAERLEFLRKSLSHVPNFDCDTEVFVVTNAEGDEEHASIRSAARSDVEIVVPRHLGHPYLLTWVHMGIFRSRFTSDQSISHFMYLEDDLEVKPSNLHYWAKARDDLRPFGLIPSFIRYEIAEGGSDKVSTDITSPVDFAKTPKAGMSGANYCYINFPEPYQGMYLLDRELAQEHLFGASSSPDFGRWGIREKAAQGLTFANVPQGCFSRNFVRFNLDEGNVDSDCLLHHLPNNYANNAQSKFGKVHVKNLVMMNRALS
jgi:hypothetical protein